MKPNNENKFDKNKCIREYKEAIANYKPNYFGLFGHKKEAESLITEIKEVSTQDEYIDLLVFFYLQLLEKDSDKLLVIIANIIAQNTRLNTKLYKSNIFDPYYKLRSETNFLMKNLLQVKTHIENLDFRINTDPLKSVIDVYHMRKPVIDNYKRREELNKTLEKIKFPTALNKIIDDYTNEDYPSLISYNSMRLPWRNP